MVAGFTRSTRFLSPTDTGRWASASRVPIAGQRGAATVRGMKPSHDSGVGETASASRPSGARAYWDFIERTDPGSTERSGLTNADLDAPPLSLQESLEAGGSRPGKSGSTKARRPRTTWSRLAIRPM